MAHGAFASRGLRSARVLDAAPDTDISKLERLGKKYKQACADESDAVERKKKYAALLLVETKRVGIEEENDKGEPRFRAESDSLKFVTIRGANSTISAAKLAALNVPAKTIKRATVTVEYEYVRVDPKKE